MFGIVARDRRSGAVGAAAVYETATLASVTPRREGAIVLSLGAPPPGIFDPPGIADPTGVADPLDRAPDLREALRTLLATDSDRDTRQLLVVDARGRTAAHSGRSCPRLFGHTEGTDHSAGGNGMDSANVVGAMSLSFERSDGDPLWLRLALAVESGASAAQEVRLHQIARLVVYPAGGGPAIDVQIGARERPTADLRRALSDSGQ